MRLLQIVINLDKRNFVFLIVFIGLIGGLAIAYDNDGEGGDPVSMGHTFNEMDGGTAELGQVDGSSILGMTIVGTPTDGSSLLIIRDTDVTVPGGNALKVEGHVFFGSSGNVYVPGLTDGLGATSGNYPICVYRSSVGDGNQNGKLVRCSDTPV